MRGPSQNCISALETLFHCLSTPPVVDAVLGKYAPVPTTNGAGQVVQPAKGKTPAAIGLEDFDLLKVIGKGSFGKVRLLLVSDN